ncbi:MAG: glycosyltransferase family 2 protein [Robiginitomaculum sp.]
MTTKITKLPAVHPAKRISVVMVTYHTGASLQEAIRAVIADKDVFELILVDNGNSVQARECMWLCANGSARVRVLQGHGNIGFGRACNYGAKMCKGDYILFLNPDAIMAKGAALSMADCGENLKLPWITGGFLQTVDGREQRGSRRSKLTPIGALISFMPLHKLFGLQSIHLENTPVTTLPTPMPIVSGACMMMSRDSFKILGGFDEGYFLHVEDIDVCKRADATGGDVYFVPFAKVMHYGSTSRVSVQKVEYEKFKGFVRYFWKYSPKWWAKVLTVLAVPGMYVALMGRAWWIAFQKVWKV